MSGSEAQSKRILIVDDSDLARDIAAEALTAQGYVLQQASGIDQLAELEPAAADLILMDVQLAEVFGDDLASVLKDVHGVTAPIFLYSNLDHEALQERVEEAGLAGYICKHDGLDALVETVNKALA